jgi:hypothetical protein
LSRGCKILASKSIEPTLEQLAPADTELAHHASVEVGDDLKDRRVELDEREEAPVA